MNIDELIFDNKNFNLHTAEGMALIERSLREHGAGRSVLIDKDNRLIGGNGVVEAAKAVGINKVKVVEVEGDELVAVKRKDVSLDSQQGRAMALADNATAAADLAWDEEAIRAAEKDFNISADEWGLDLDFKLDDEPTDDELDGEDRKKPFTAKLTFSSETMLKKFIKEQEQMLADDYGCTISYSGGEL